MKSLLTTLLLITGISMAQQPPNPLPPSIPQRISFQAMITDTLGNPVTDGTHNFTFRINRPTQAGQVQTIWEETKQVTVVDGLISTILGSVNPIGFIPFSDNYFLRVALDNEVISVSPLTSVPFAFNALRAMGANNATHADTANFTHHAMHADTANYINLGNYNGSISVIEDDDAAVTIHSTDDNSSSFLTLISQTSAGVQRELRVINEGDIGGGFRFYDATNGEDLMVIDTSGKMGLGVSSPSEKLDVSGDINADTVKADVFVGDGSQLTGISTGATIGFPNTQVFSGAVPTSWTELDLSSVVGQNQSLVMIKAKFIGDENPSSLTFKPNGNTESWPIGNSSNHRSTSLIHAYTNESATGMITTDENGIVEWKTWEMGTVELSVVCYLN